MHIVLSLAIIINILFIIVLLTGLFYKFKQPKNKAVHGYLIAGCMISYILTLVLALIYGFLEKHFLHSFILFLCTISPFIIGKLVNYNSLKLYTIIQILSCLFSLIILLILL